ncbi:MAG: hypothetical protein KDJ99_02080, partial [Candidatus Competibacteraceae bacterium]|nr:hypothetical protein [Candidatus Competibacteraceae bacterium]
MPDFNTLTGKTAWSDRRNYTSGRVTTGTTERPAAEYRLKDRQIEIRTGARVTRARGPWVGFKRKFTAGGH